LAWSDRLDLLRDAVKGVHQLHRFHIAHRDLKTENILLVQQGAAVKAVIADLGRSRDVGQPAQLPPVVYEHFRGDYRFAPPEFIWAVGSDDEHVFRRSDLYQAGSLFYEIATGQGITSVALPGATNIRANAMSLSLTDRRADFGSNMSGLRAQYEPAFAAFERELPPSIRFEGTRLLRQLCDPDPRRREPAHYSKSVLWDLQWILRRIDILRHQLAYAEHQAQALEAKRLRRKATTP
jgi:serine/threonine protein kinase